ncbi:MAG: AMP-binding protein [Acidobacteriota bacterium]
MNVAELLLRKYEDAVFRIALQEVKCAGINTYTFGGLDYLSDKFATILKASGIAQGDVVAVVLPQSAAFAVAHLAILKIGAVVLPIKTSTKLTHIKPMLTKGQAKCLIVGDSNYKKFRGIQNKTPEIENVFIACDIVSKNDFGEGLRSFWFEINFADANFTIVEPLVTQPAYLFSERDPQKKFIKHPVNYGDILNSLNESEIEKPKAQTVWTTRDWTEPEIIFEMIFKMWAGGNAIATYDSTFTFELPIREYYDHLGYKEYFQD